MNLARSVDRARSVNCGTKEAARLYNDIEYELALGDHTEEEYAAGEEALGILDERCPGVRNAARSNTDPPRTSRTASHNLENPPEHSTRRRRNTPTPTRRQPSAPRRQPSAPRRQGAPRPTTTSARVGAPAVARRAAALAPDTGGWGELVGQFFLWGMALSIGYLLLTRAAAAGKLFEGGAVAVRALVSPTIDPLNPKGAL